MCYAHWKKVPRKIQLAVWKHYRAGQCDDKDFTREWAQAADAAIGYIAMLESQPIRNVEVEAMLTFGVKVTGELVARGGSKA